MNARNTTRPGLLAGISLLVIGLSGGVLHAQESSPTVATSVDQAETQDAGAPAWIPALVVEPLSREQIDIFFDSVRASSPYTPPQVHISQKVDAATSGIWSGATFDADGEVAEVILRFRPSIEERLKRAEGGKSSEQLAESVDVGIRLGVKGLQFSHSMARDSAMRGGFISPLKLDRRDRTRTAFVRGVQESGMYLSVPPMLMPEASENWSVLVCPRSAAVVKDAKSGALHLELTSSPYELSEVKMSFSANASARVPTLNSKERIKMQIFTTEHVPAPIVSEDEEFSVSPSLQIAYHPSATNDFFRFAPHSSTQQGLRVMCETENPAGHIRRAYFSSTLYIQKLNEPSPVSVIINGALVARDEGACYVVQRRKSHWAEYDRVTPARQERKAVR